MDGGGGIGRNGKILTNNGKQMIERCNKLRYNENVTAQGFYFMTEEITFDKMIKGRIFHELSVS